MSKRTPNSFKLVDVEVIVFLQKMNQLDVLNYLIDRVSEGTKALVVTLLNIIGVKLTKFCFITIRVVQLLKFIVRVFTEFIVTLLDLTYKVTVRNVRWSSFVLFIMVVKTGFSFVKG